MTSVNAPAHVVVDGSNIATEGRSLPSLTQLSEAVMSFMEEYPDTAITVVVDATFGHRIDKKEVKEFEEGISNNELVAPPAGAVGRGDAFVLAIADKSNASILSNDSFQEFHADHQWLFDDGRLIGGKPVPHVGWVFVERLPVRGPVSRKATGSSRGSSRRTSKSDSQDSGRGSSNGSGRGRKASVAATEPMPVPKSPPPGRRTPPAASAAHEEPTTDTASERQSAPRAGDVVNELMPFLEFVEHHPIGTSVNGTVDSYSSHGAYVSIGNDGVRGYVPLRLMADPAPSSARKVMRIGESVTLVVVSFAAARRSIDCAIPDLAQAAIQAARAEDADSPPDVTLEDAVAEAEAEAVAVTEVEPKPTTKVAAKRASAKRAPAKKVAAKKAPAKKVAAKKAPAKKVAAKKAPAKKAAAEKVAAEKVAAEKAPATTAVATEAPATKSPATKTAAKKVAAKKAPAQKVAAKKAPAAKAPAAKAPAANAPAAKKAPGAKKAPSAKQAPAERAPAARKAPAKKAPATKKAPAKRAPAKKAPATKSPAKKAPATTTGPDAATTAAT